MFNSMKIINHLYVLNNVNTIGIMIILLLRHVQRIIHVKVFILMERNYNMKFHLKINV